MEAPTLNAIQFASGTSNRSPTLVYRGHYEHYARNVIVTVALSVTPGIRPYARCQRPNAEYTSVGVYLRGNDTHIKGLARHPGENFP